MIQNALRWNCLSRFRKFRHSDLAQKFRQRFHRFDMGAKNLECGQDWDSEDDAGDSPHPAPEDQGKKNEHWIQRKRTTHYPWRNEVTFERTKAEIDGGEDERVAKAVEA